MNSKNIYQFIDFLSHGANVFAPYLDKKEKKILIRKVSIPQEVNFDSEAPFYSWRKFFLPQKEIILAQNKDKSFIKVTSQPQVMLGMNILDLRALVLLDHIFEKDAYYQSGRRSILTVGYAKTFNLKNKRADIFEEDILEHIRFDIFILQNKEVNSYRFLSGSRRGQATLEKFGKTEYEHVEFAGPIREEGKDDWMLKCKKLVKNREKNKKIWADLSKKCIACGKCSLVCPTCFCFDFKDEIGEGGAGQRNRVWGNCFYPEFSEIAGGAKFLNNIEDRIYFWYYHKFVFIPEKFSIPGCVGCNRCTAVCPAGIDIRKVLNSLK